MVDDEVTLTKNRQKVISFILKNPESLLLRSTLQDLFTITEKPIVDLQKPFLEKNVYKYRLVSNNSKLFYVSDFNRTDVGYDLTLEPTDIDDIEDRLICPRTRFMLQPGDIVNYPDNGINVPIETSFGKYLVNYVLHASIFNDVIPYLNYPLNASKLNSVLEEYVLSKKVTIEQCNQRLINITYLEIPEYVAPNVSVNSLRIDPMIQKKKKELLELHKDELKAGDPVVMANIEKQLIDMDKENIKKDLSSRYLIKGKQFDVIRKKMNITQGMHEIFGKPNHFEFINNSLSEGWKQKDFPTIANEIRSGSYSRAKETAVSGEESNFILSVLQNIRITMDDCKSTKYNILTLTPNNYLTFVGRRILTDNGLLLLDEVNIQKYLNKVVKMRSPLCCVAPDGFCYTCVDEIFKTLEQESIATKVQAVSSMFLNLSLKKMHGKSIKSVNISDLNRYLI